MNTPLQKVPEEIRKDLEACAQIDARLAASEARSGGIPSETFFAELRANYGN